MEAAFRTRTVLYMGLDFVRIAPEWVPHVPKYVYIYIYIPLISETFSVRQVSENYYGNEGLWNVRGHKTYKIL